MHRAALKGKQLLKCRNLLVAKLKKLAEGNDLVVKFEAIKSDIRSHHEEMTHKYHFFRSFYTDHSLSEHLKDMRDNFEKRAYAAK